MSSPLTISIAMCTYNGERFLQEQLESLSSQTRLPDEVVICDDCSQDNTLALIKEFAAWAPFPVRISVNQKNVGIAKNFEKVVSLCRSDISAFCDQDDVWLPEKLAITERTFEASPHIGCLFSDALLVDEKLHSLGYSLWDAIEFKPRYRDPSQKSFYQFIVKTGFLLGATTAFRTQLAKQLLPFPPGWYHDDWLPLAFCASTGIEIIPQLLIKYRQHASQLYGVKPKSIADNLSCKSNDREYYLDSAYRWASIISFLCTYKDLKIKKFFLAAALDQILHLKNRGTMPPSLRRRFPVIWQEVINRRYRNCSNGVKSVLKDLLLFEQILK